jgi:hypothetical protein
MLKLQTPSITIFWGSLVALTYGLSARLAFQSPWEDFLGLITLGFVIFVPLAIGALTVAFAPRRYKSSWVYGIFMPWLPCILLGIVAIVLAWEVAICIVMALPLFMVMSSIGGIIMTAIFSRLSQEDQRSTPIQSSLLGLILLAPFIVAPIENQFPAPDSIRTVETQIVIQAGPEGVWDNLVAVPPIRPEEHHFTVFNLLGLPWPVEATLSQPGLEGVRRASYDNGLAILEPVTVWEPYRHYAFGVQLDPTVAPPPPFEQVGGKYFEVQRVRFRLETAETGVTVLHLQSQYRLSTRLNFYGGWWIDFLLGDLQDYILGVIKARAEASR